MSPTGFIAFPASGKKRPRSAPIAIAVEDLKGEVAMQPAHAAPKRWPQKRRAAAGSIRRIPPPRHSRTVLVGQAPHRARGNGQSGRVARRLQLLDELDGSGHSVGVEHELRQ